MTHEEAYKIINEDDDWLDIRKWKRKHYQAYNIFLKLDLGAPLIYRIRIRRLIKKIARRVRKKDEKIS